MYIGLEIYKFVSKHNEMLQTNIKTRCLYCDVGNEFFQLCYSRWVSCFLNMTNLLQSKGCVCVCVLVAIYKKKLCCVLLSLLPYRIGAFRVETLHFRAAYGVRRCSALSPNKVQPNIIWNFIDDHKCFYEILLCAPTQVHIGRNFEAATDACEKLSLQYVRLTW